MTCSTPRRRNRRSIGINRLRYLATPSGRIKPKHHLLVGPFSPTKGEHMELLSYLWQYIVEVFGLFISYVFAAIFIFLVLRRLHSRNITIALVVIFIGVSIAFYIPNGIPTAVEIPMSLRTFGPSASPVLPIANVVHFFQKFGDFERVPDIARSPVDVPKTVTYGEGNIVEISTTTKEVIGTMAD